MVVANLGWDLQVASAGRFVLGIGPQVKAHNERRFSVPWSAPAPRMKEYVQSLRAIWRAWKSGETLQFEGEHYSFTLMTPNFLPPKIGSVGCPTAGDHGGGRPGYVAGSGRGGRWRAPAWVLHTQVH